MGDAANIEPAAVPVFDPLFVQEVALDAAKVVRAATIRTSRLVVLTQEKTEKLGNVVQVATTGDLTVYGDVVRVVGIIEAHERTVTIFCRRLEFHSGAAGKSGFDVSGEKGAVGEPKGIPADRGKDGDDKQRENRAGKPGKAGTDGNKGCDGGHGGKIHIYCDTLIRYAPVVLNASGGRGGEGGTGQQGGRGGNGTSGYTDQEDVAFAYGGQGGCGGNGGSGGAGGQGGEIELYFMTIDDDAAGARRVTYDARGGDGGTGGQPGKGGTGGDGGSPDPGRMKRYQWSHLDGADAGGGGICGLPGDGGPPGPSGEISLTKPGDWCTPSFTPVKLPEFPPPPEIAKPGVEGADFGLARRDPRNFELARRANEAARAAYIAEHARIARERNGLLCSFPHAPDSQKPGPAGEPLANPDERAEDGQTGKGGPTSVITIPQDQNKSKSQTIAAGSDGHVRQSDLKRNTKTSALAGSAHPTAQHVPEIGYGDLRGKGDIEQLEMVLHHVRTRYLLTALPVPAGELQSLVAVLQWLVLLTNDKAKQGVEADKRLGESALATLWNVLHECNIFGKDAQFAALGSFEQYKVDLEEMLKSFKEVEEVYKELNVDLNAAAEKETYLNSVVKSQDGLIGRLTTLEEDTVKSLKTTLSEVVTLEGSRDDLAHSVEDAMRAFTAEISSKFGLTPGDIWNLFTQLSFTNREVTGKEGGLLLGGAAAAGAMVIGQVGDLATKAIENVATDTGGSINKKYMIRRMEYLGKDVKSVGGLKQARDGLLKADASAEVRLQATRDQVESICSNFYEQIPKAKEISETLDAYIEAVAARNAKVEEYNQALSQLAYLRAELDKVKEQQDQVSGALQKGASPGLPAMANFFTALRRHAQERCVEQLYFASRVYTLESLDSYDVFADVLGRLAANAQPGDLNSAALNAGLIDLVSASLTNRQKHKTSRNQFVPQGDHCTLRLTPKTDPLLFVALKNGKAGTFTIPPPDSYTTIDRNPFAGMSDIRLTNIRCIADGMTTSDGVQQIEITHTGLDTFVTEDGRKVQLKHNPVTHTSVYNARTGKHTGNGALDEDHRMIGPCGVWRLEIRAALNEGLKPADLKSITVEFEGMMRAFVPGGTPAPGAAAAGV